MGGKIGDINTGILALCVAKDDTFEEILRRLAQSPDAQNEAGSVTPHGESPMPYRLRYKGFPLIRLNAPFEG